MKYNGLSQILDEAKYLQQRIKNVYRNPVMYHPRINDFNDVEVMYRNKSAAIYFFSILNVGMLCFLFIIFLNMSLGFELSYTDSKC